MSNETEAAPAGSNSPFRPSASRALRVWPAVILVPLMIVTRFVPAFLEGGLAKYWMFAMMGPMVCCLLLVIWWLAASRATWKERVFGFLGLAAVFAMIMALVEPLMRGPGTIYITLPMGMSAFVLGAALFQKRRPLARTSATLLLAAAGFGFSVLLRNGGMNGEYQLTLHWRWAPTAEEQMLAARTTSSAAPKPNMPSNLGLANPEWPGFRGADRSGSCHGPMIATNWSEHLPKQLWKVPVGPGWSSFAVAGNLLFTQEQRGLLAFDVETGALRWSAATGDHTYASPQLNTIAGEELVQMLSNDGLVLVEPATGKARLNYEWKFSGYRALQPRVVGDDTVLLGTPMNIGTRAIHITKVNGELAAEELWTSRNLKPDFSDMVTYQGYIYGNDGGFLTCLDLKTGDRMWKGGRYGKGQLLLLENSGLVLVAAEDGQVHLVRADPKEFVEVDSFKALEGKTWNHPVVVGDKLYVHNSQEAAEFQLLTAKHAERARKM